MPEQKGHFHLSSHQLKSKLSVVLNQMGVFYECDETVQLSPRNDFWLFVLTFRINIFTLNHPDINKCGPIKELQLDLWT